MLFKIAALNSQISLEKHLSWNLFLRKLDLPACNFIKKKLQQRRFPVKFATF